MQKTIALRIRSARQSARLTQAELATRLNLSRSAIAQWESASGSAPSTTNLASLALALECSFEWLATGKTSRSVGRIVGDRAPYRADARGDDPSDTTVVYRHFARDDEEEQLIEAFRELDAFDRAAVVALTETLSARPMRSRKDRRA